MSVSLTAQNMLWNWTLFNSIILLVVNVIGYNLSFPCSLFWVLTTISVLAGYIKQLDATVALRSRSGSSSARMPSGLRHGLWFGTCLLVPYRWYFWDEMKFLFFGIPFWWSQAQCLKNRADWTGFLLVIFLNYNYNLWMCIICIYVLVQLYFFPWKKSLTGCV